MKTELLNPQNSALILIDVQPQMTFGVANIDRQTLFNNVMLLAKAAKIFNVPTILTTVETKSFSGNFWPQVLDIFPDQEPVVLVASQFAKKPEKAAGKKARA